VEKKEKPAESSSDSDDGESNGSKLRQIVESRTLNFQHITARTAQIHEAVLEKSRSIDAANFTRIHTSDMELLFTEYDAKFFDGEIKASLGSMPLSFGLSGRMTSAGGKTVSYIDQRTGRRCFEIRVSTTILFGCFADGDRDHRPVSASGILCRDRLDSLQRVIEHELVHLVEMLLWNTSNCSQARFHSIAQRLFGHTKSTHNLITPKERARVQFCIKPGARVRFMLDGLEYNGIVNRISQRATVLVENACGKRFSDGKHYAKFYVPVQLLQAVE
jgi:hypothetical protein